MTLVLDSGALIAIEKGERAMWIRLKACGITGDRPVTHAGVVGEVWRGGASQARLAQALKGIEVRPLDDRLGRAAGIVLGATGQSDVIDASLALLTRDGDDVVTSDREDFRMLLATIGRHVELICP